MVEHCVTEDLTASLVREYLSRKKCSQTLQALDVEIPRNDGSISNRIKLAQALKIECWMQANRSSGHSFRTMLEVIVHNACLKDHNLAYSSNLVADGVKFKKEEKPSGSIYKPLQSTSTEKALKEPMLMDSSVQSIELIDLDKEEMNFNNRSAQSNVHCDYLATKTKSSSNLSPVIPSKSRPSTAPLASIHNDHDEISSSTSCHTHGGSESRPKQKVSSVFEMLSASPEKAINAKKQQIKEVPKHKTVINSKEMLHFESGFQKDNGIGGLPTGLPTGLTNPNLASKTVQNSYEKNHDEIFEMSDSKQRSTNLVYDFETLKDLRNLIFGSVKSRFSSEWLNQSFSFCDCTDGRPSLLRFGIVQLKGGPCGILACVQATLLKYLLFSYEERVSSASVLNVSDSKRTECLAKAIAEILWRAGGNRQAWLAVPTLHAKISCPPTFRSDGISENLLFKSFTSYDNLLNGVKENVQFYEKGRGSCILLLYSAICSRGIDAVHDDMDESGGRLMGAHNYCTQEMINLLLVGCASSNAFDKSIKLDGSTLLKGVPGQSNIGMLSLFEHYDSCKIGKYYKYPKYPLWVVCSESHFTVLFSLDMEVAIENSTLKCFDLFYYDGLANQDEVIRLSVDTTALLDESELQGELVPPLEHCIRTRWKNASINWNGTDPIL